VSVLADILTEMQSVEYHDRQAGTQPVLRRTMKRCDLPLCTCLLLHAAALGRTTWNPGRQFVRIHIGSLVCFSIAPAMDLP
jgi:hypothetical protein